MFADHNGHKLNQMDEAYQQIIESKLQQTEEHFAIARQRYHVITTEINFTKEEMAKHHKS
jgi:hypothetical protein